MSKAEAFGNYYPLTPGREQILETVLTGQEVPIRLPQAMVDRLKEQAKLAEMTFLAAATLEDHTIRIYFITPDGLFLKDIPFVSRDPGHDLFLNMMAYKASQGEFDLNEEDFYVEVEHRPN